MAGLTDPELRRITGTQGPGRTLGQPNEAARAPATISEATGMSSHDAVRPRRSVMNGSMTAGGVCSRNVETTGRAVSVADAARQMRDRRVGYVVVVEDGDAGSFPVGLLTDRDIVVRIVARALDPGLLCVGDVASDAIHVVREERSMQEVLAVMQRHGVRRLPVCTFRGALVGIITIDDVLAVISSELTQAAQIVGGDCTQEGRSLW